MKKILVVLMLTALVLSLCACGGSRNSGDSYSSNSGTSAVSSSSSGESSYSSGSSDDSGKSSTSFSNDYGTSGTLCAVSGCTNTIASSGDTNCCTAHSNRCLECGCYIDGDAMYCMDCLERAVDSAYDDSDYDDSYDDSYDFSYDDSDYDYDYDMPEEGESFSDYVQRVDPDLYSEMEDIWESLE